MRAMQSKLITEFADAEYAHAYMDSHTIDRIAGQIYWTRKKRDWTQAELAKRAGMVQERISKIEAGDFSSLTMKTLRKLAEALDVNLRIEFEPFSHGIMNVCNLAREQLELPTRVESLQNLKQSLGIISTPFGLRPVIIPGVITLGSAVTSVGESSAMTAAPLVTQWPTNAEICV